MAIEILPAEDADMVEIFTISSEAFERNEEFYTAHFTDHDTPEGRVKGGKRFLDAKLADTNVVFMKAVDRETGQIAGFAKWLIFKDKQLETPPLDTQHWDKLSDAEYAHALLIEFLKYRQDHLGKTNGNMVSLDICAVSPKFQRRGVGNKLVTWGTQKADSMGVDTVVESSTCGRGLYEKHGFIWQKDVVLPVPEKFGARPDSKFAWLVRPKTLDASA